VSQVTQAQPDLQASETAIRIPPTEVVGRLSDILGARLVAYLAGVKDARTVKEWASGSRPIKSPRVLPRLRHALRIALFLSEHEGPDTIQAWFQGLNPQLDDRVPLEVLRDSDQNDRRSDEVLAVVAAAIDFASSGGPDGKSGNRVKSCRAPRQSGPRRDGYNSGHGNATSC
jgi:hypothetical protein